MNIPELFQKLNHGDRAALGRAITLVESGRTSDRDSARELVESCLPHAGRSLRIGLTGIPGVGKSTLVEALGMHVIGQGHKVAVLAIDPSSQRSGGSILGDKTRMEKLSNHPDAFIRPTPTGGNLGGVARRTRETIVLCEAAGYDRILVETVGVGQSELEVDRMTDLNALLMIAGAGDELQGIKRGIMESADVVVFTKADGDAEDRAKIAARELKNAMALLPARDTGRQPEILLTSALEGKGIAGLSALLEEMKAADDNSGRTARHRKGQALFWLEQAIAEGLSQRFSEDEAVKIARGRLEDDVRAGRKSPFDAAAELLDLYKPQDQGGEGWRTA